MTDQENLKALAERINQQSNKFPQGYPFDRNGLRLAIAAIEDETGELYEEWSHNKRHLGNAHTNIRYELLDIAAVCMLALRNIDVMD
jgi:NTP pyrophosphatase (non-canonical NTP hydrolase)